MNNYWKAAHEVDRRLGRAGVQYCIIKSYCGREDYDDGNIDVVVDVPLRTVYAELFADGFHVTFKDKLKALLYERNKLMLTPNVVEMAKIHLHTNAGWHNVCFVSAQEIFQETETKIIAGWPIRVLSKNLEGRICLMHSLFEKFAISSEDSRFLRDWNVDEPQGEMGLNELEWSRLQKKDGDIAIRELLPIWRRFYFIHPNVSIWNRFLHLLLVVIQLKRRVGKARIKAE